MDAIKQEIVENEVEIASIDEQLSRLSERRADLKKKQKLLHSLLQESLLTEKETTDWTKCDYSWSQQLKTTMNSKFKISSFRPLQLEAINITMSKRDCILIMPTGGGKSLCYQLPAIMSDGITVVVSPLVSLMEDQVHCLDSIGLGHTCGFFSAGQSKSASSRLLKEMANTKSDLRLVFVTPEKLSKSRLFMSVLEKVHAVHRFKRLAIDEVHCISQWGHDFRPDYKTLGIMKRQFPSVPILGLTATMTSKVGADVKKLLGIQDCIQLKASFNRPNLNYIVMSKSSSGTDVIGGIHGLIKEQYAKEQGIIYCLTIKDAEDVAAELEKRNISAAAYHAQLDATCRSKVHSDWLKGHLKIVVATIAFGMGINKPDVRFVIHHSISKSMENYYQESGRAGRDGKPADCIIFYKLSDLFRLSTMVFKDFTGVENLYKMAAYCVSLRKCRRSLIADHFGEEWDSAKCEGMCDNCRKKDNQFSSSEVDVTCICQDIYNILSAEKQADRRLTALKIIDKMAKKQGKVKSSPLLSRDMYEYIITVLLIEGYLKEDFHFTPYAVISYIEAGLRSSAVIFKGLPVKIMLPAYIKEKLSKQERSKRQGESSTDKNNEKPGNNSAKRKKLSSGNTERKKTSSKKKGVAYFSSSDDDVQIIEDKLEKRIQSSQTFYYNN